jgi:hypothetical protein
MLKAYLNRFASRKHPEEGVDYWFCSDFERCFLGDEGRSRKYWQDHQTPPHSYSLVTRHTIRLQRL